MFTAYASHHIQNVRDTQQSRTLGFLDDRLTWLNVIDRNFCTYFLHKKSHTYCRHFGWIGWDRYSGSQESQNTECYTAQIERYPGAQESRTTTGPSKHSSLQSCLRLPSVWALLQQERDFQLGMFVQCSSFAPAGEGFQAKLLQFSSAPRRVDCWV